MDKERKNRILRATLMVLIIASSVFAVILQCISGFNGDTKAVIIKNIYSADFWISWTVRFLVLTMLWLFSNLYFKNKLEDGDDYAILCEEYKKWNKIRKETFNDFLVKKNLQIKIGLYMEDINNKVSSLSDKLSRCNDTSHRKNRLKSKIEALNKKLEPDYIKENIKYIRIKRYTAIKEIYFTNEYALFKKKTKTDYVNNYGKDTNKKITKRLPKNLATTLLSSVLAILIVTWNFNLFSFLYMFWLIAVNITSAYTSANTTFDKNLQSPLVNKIEVLKDYCNFEYGFYTLDVNEALGKIKIEKQSTNKEQAYRLAEQISKGEIKMVQEDGKLIGLDKDGVKVFEKDKEPLKQPLTED